MTHFKSAHISYENFYGKFNGLFVYVPIYYWIWTLGNTMIFRIFKLINYMMVCDTLTKIYHRIYYWGHERFSDLNINKKSHYEKVNVKWLKHREHVLFDFFYALNILTIKSPSQHIVKWFEFKGYWLEYTSVGSIRNYKCTYWIEYFWNSLY